MPDNLIKIEVHGIKELQAKLAKFPREVKQTMEAAGEEAAKYVLRTEGLQKYPPSTEANKPPAPYYIRGRGMMYKSGLKATSERLGTQWTVESADFKTTIANRASYAKWVHGADDQAKAMEAIGWRKLVEVPRRSRRRLPGYIICGLKDYCAN